MSATSFRADPEPMSKIITLSRDSQMCFQEQEKIETLTLIFSCLELVAMAVESSTLFYFGFISVPLGIRFVFLSCAFSIICILYLIF